MIPSDAGSIHPGKRKTEAAPITDPGVSRQPRRKNNPARKYVAFLTGKDPAVFSQEK